ncbi:MAG: hypothetical protein Q8M77_04460 [Hydrogenophaga sp.]|nr:hypothetical protein [Hydrogenophaga sp.]
MFAQVAALSSHVESAHIKIQGRRTVATNADIHDCLGAEAATYAANKERGGSSGKKGARYEDFFLAYKTAEAAVCLLSDPEGHNPHIKGQVFGFVDDARVASDAATHYFQLKNKAAVSWTAGARPLETDFAYQVALSKHLSEPETSTHLVVPTAELAEALRASVPGGIKAHSHVHQFPWTETANRLVLECEELREWLLCLANVENPTDDVLSGALGILLMASIERPDGATARELVECACRMYPGQLRMLPAGDDWERHFKPEFTQVLAKIPGLVYGAKRGYFYWSAFNTSGVFGSYVLSDEFTEFQNLIVQNNPKTFEEFEEVLP